MKPYLNIIIILFLSLLSINCGIIAPNIATITITSDDDDTTDSYTGVDLKNVTVANDTKKTTNINKGTRKKFDVHWWGEHQYPLPISYSVIPSDDRIYITTTIHIKNFDNITIHLGEDANSWNKKQSPQIEYK